MTPEVHKLLHTWEIVNFVIIIIIPLFRNVFKSYCNSTPITENTRNRKKQILNTKKINSMQNGIKSRYRIVIQRAQGCTWGSGQSSSLPEFKVQIKARGINGFDIPGSDLHP
jgi:hypothetical protein